MNRYVTHHNNYYSKDSMVYARKMVCIPDYEVVYFTCNAPARIYFFYEQCFKTAEPISQVRKSIDGGVVIHNVH